MGAVHRWRLGDAPGRRDFATGRVGTTGCRSAVSGPRVSVRVALIGPVPPRLGGWTSGGVATHQVHLATGLAAAGIFAPLLATNTRTPPRASRAADAEAPFPLYRIGRLRRARGQYLLAVGPQRLVWY